MLSVTNPEHLLAKKDPVIPACIVFRVEPPGRVYVLDVMPEERDALVTLLRELSPSDWSNETACPGWTVHDVAAHILGTDLRNLSGGREEYSPPGQMTEEPETWADLVALVNRLNEEWVRATRWIGPVTLRELLEFTGRRVQEYFLSVSLAESKIVVSWANPDPAPNWLHIAREYTERWVHQQQIRDAVERPGLTEVRFMRPMIDTFMRALPRAYASCHIDIDAAVLVEVVGAAGSRWLIRHTNGEWHLFKGDGDHGQRMDATVRIDEETTWRFLSRNLDPWTARQTADIEGDEVLVEPFFRAVAAIVAT